MVFKKIKTAGHKIVKPRNFYELQGFILAVPTGFEPVFSL